MKKRLFSVIISVFFTFINLFAASVPENLAGIWEGIDRLVFMENDDNGDPHLTVILKDYYGWYYDRALEDLEYAEKEKRIRNTATSKTAASAKIDFPESLSDEMIVTYSKREVKNISYRLLNGNMYFNFWDIIPVEGAVFYKGKLDCEGILISTKNTKNEFSCYVQADDGTVYRVRYWKTNMDYNAQAVAEIKHAGSENGYIYIPKMLVSEGEVFTCATGRRTVVRNQERVSELFNGAQVVFSEDNSFAVLQEPHYLQLADKRTFEELMEMVKEANSRRKPDPAPLFPDANLDYHWDLIDILENGNQIIMEIRQRQKDFGPRGKDVGK